MPEECAAFTGSIPENYDRYLGPVLFEPYAVDLAARLHVQEGAVLEVACGTGIVTQQLRRKLPANVRLVATDLNDAMLEYAKTKFQPNEAIEWKQADAAELPFRDKSFAAVVCQFGWMFMPDKLQAAQEAHRVLQPGGAFLFNVWDAIEHNDLARITHATIATFFEHDPPEFYKFPFGFHDRELLRSLLSDAHFENITLTTLKFPSVSPIAANLVTGLVEGNPVIFEINKRSPDKLEQIKAAVAEAIVAHYGDQPVRAGMQAIVCSGTK